MMSNNDWFFDGFAHRDDPDAKRIGPVKGLIGFFATSTAMGLLGSMFLVPAVAVGGASINGASDYWESLPSVLPAEPIPARSVILDKNGATIGTFYSENRVNVALKDISPNMKKTILASEDARFYDRGPLDWRGLARAAASGSGGGSTITQQYVKNVLLNNADTEAQRKAATEQTYKRKIQELKYAVAVEKKLSKDQILGGYLNIAYFGDGAYGVGAAAMHYFGVPASKLTIEQSALLAGLVQSPDAYNPRLHPKAAKVRRDSVFGRLAATGDITEAQRKKFVNTPIRLNVTNPANGCSTSAYPFYCQMVRNELSSNPVFGKTPEARAKFLYKGGLTIRTALDPKAMRAAQDAAENALGSQNSFAGASAIVEPGTGHIIGVGQSRTWKQSQVNLATSKFQNGSTMKAITLAAAVENGWSVTNVVNALPKFCAPKPNTGCFTNSSKADVGPMNSITAMARSSNTFFTQLSVQIGTDKVQAMANRLGWNLPKNVTGHETATTLGVYDVSPVTVANGYATIAAHGVYCNPVSIVSVVNSSGKAVPVPQANCHQEISPAVADTVANTLSQVIDGPDPSRTGKGLSIGRPVMAKTGTTEYNSAVWMAGAVPQASVATWVGDPKGGFSHPVKTLRLYGRYVGAAYGGTGAGPIWKDTMMRYTAGLPVKGFSLPSTTIAARQHAVVPNVVGMSLPVAVKVIRDAGLTPVLDTSKQVAGENLPVNVVASQSIDAGKMLPGAGTVRLMMSVGSNKNVKIVQPSKTTPDKPVGLPDLGGGVVG